MPTVILTFKDNGELFDPYTVDSVVFLTTADVVLETVTPVRLSTGRYSATGSFTTKVFKSRWTWKAISSMEFNTEEYLTDTSNRGTVGRGRDLPYVRVLDITQPTHNSAWVRVRE